MNITACVIVKNEEKNLPRWLSCMQQIADEIIVVDTGSTDKTKDIALKNQVKLYEFIWCDDFAVAKNYALSKATGDWILFLDADEYFPDAVLPEIQKYLIKVSDNIDAFLCRIENIDNRKNYISSFLNMRIIRNKPYLRYKGKVHEILVNTKTKSKINAAIMDSDVYIFHTGYSGELTVQKLRRNLLLLKQDIKENGIRSTHYIYLAECYAGMQQYDKAVKCCEKFLQSGSDAVGMRIYIYIKMIEIMNIMGADKLKIENIIISAMQEFPNDVELLYYKAQLAYQSQNYIVAENIFKKVLDNTVAANNSPFNVSTIKGKYFIIYACLGQIYVWKDNLIEARKYYIKSLQYNSHNESVLLNLYKLIAHDNIEVVIDTLNKIYVDDVGDIKFLLQVLYRDFPDTCSLYYRQYLQKKYQLITGKDIVTDFMIVKKYVKAAQENKKNLADIYSFLSALVIKNKLANSNEYISILPNEYQKIILTNEKKGGQQENNIYKNIQIVLKNIK